MKKLLALVLALVMTLSLCVVSSNAFSDVEGYDAEAIEVLNDIGVIKGYEDGTFKPTGTLTRAEGATIITRLLGMDKLSLTGTFSDTKGHWAESAIAYCAGCGICDGVGGGNFDPNDTLTGYAFAKWCLVALGYDAKIEGMTGGNWEIGVAILIDDIDLDDEIDSFKGNEPATREIAARLALNTLQAVEVKYGKSQNVKDNGESSVTTSLDYSYKTKDGALLTLMADVFSDLKKVEKVGGVQVRDDYGRPAHKWVNDKDTIGTYADSADLTYTVAVKGTVLADDLDDAGIDVSSTASVNVWTNGDCQVITASAVATALASTAELGGKGILVETFSKDDVLTDVVATVVYLAEVDSITADKASTKSVDERALSLKVGDKTVTADEDTDNFDAVYAAVEEGDMVLVTPYKDLSSSGTTAIAVAIPETVKGVMSYKGSSKIKVDGTTYDVAKLGIVTADVDDDEATVYLDAYGYVMDVDGFSSTDDKSVVVLKLYDTLNKDGEIVKMVKGVTSNGEIVNWEYVADSYSESDVNYSNLTKNTVVYTYEEDDDTYSFTAASEATNSSTYDGGETYAISSSAELKTSSKKLAVYTTTNKYFADDVNFIFVDDGKAVTKTGAQKVAANKVMGVTINDGGDIATVFVKNKVSNSVTSSDALVFVADNTASNIRVKDTAEDKYVTKYAYTAYIDGEEVEDFYADQSSTSVGFYENEVDEDTGAYNLSTPYDWTNEDLKVAKATLTGGTDGWYINSKMIVAEDTKTSKNEDIVITSSTVFADDTDLEISNLADLKAEVKTESNTVDIWVLFDSDNNNNALYVYIVDYVD